MLDRASVPPLIWIYIYFEKKMTQGKNTTYNLNKDLRRNLIEIRFAWSLNAALTSLHQNKFLMQLNYL